MLTAVGWLSKIPSPQEISHLTNMANIEEQLISRIIRKGQLAEVMDWGISLDDFLADEPRFIFSELLALSSAPGNQGGQLGPAMAPALYTHFTFCDDDITPLNILCTEVRKNRLKAEVRGAVQKVLEKLDHDPLEAATIGDSLFKIALDLGYNKRTDVHFHEAIGDIVTRMIQMENGADFSVAKWPWAPFNEVTLGIQRDDYVVYYGRPKSGKTWCLASIIAHIYNSGHSVLVYTKEMHPENIFTRITACLSEVPYQELRSGKLAPEERNRIMGLHDSIRSLGGLQGLVCLSGLDAPSGKDTVEWLQAKIEKYRPTVAFIDGMYLMTDSRGGKNQQDHQRVSNISRGIRQMVLATGIPAICTLQANRKAAGHSNAELDEIAYSDSIGQDATMIIRVIDDKTEPTMSLVVGGSREFHLPGIKIWNIPATNFSFKELMNERDVHKAKERDSADSPKRNDHNEITKRENAAISRQIKSI